MNIEKLIKYSPNNIYARDYYKAYNEFVRARNKLKKYEHNTDDRTSKIYRDLKNKFVFWNKKVPEKSVIAGKEEKKILAKQEENRLQERGYTTSPFYKNNHLDFLA